MLSGTILTFNIASGSDGQMNSAYRAMCISIKTGMAKLLFLTIVVFHVYTPPNIQKGLL
jgi:hypothetical protein